ncbi:MAG: sulfate transporter CysZ [Halofilum sp. (in: g-proteobacteria)]|nr:sulfate transporter CysZ [Halofilum sp. (in: g-proteobacteria)]
MLKDLARGMGYALQGFSLVRERKVLPFALIPLLINAVLFGGVIWFGIDAFQQFMESQLPEWLDWAIVRAILWILFAVSAAIVTFYTFTLLANLIAAPFNGWLAERVEVHLRGQRGDEGEERGLLGEITASFGAELRKLVYMALWTLPLLLLFVIPGINLLAPPLWLLFGAWMMSLEYIDCPLGNHGVVFSRGRGLIAQRRGVALGFGGTVMVFTMIPGLNLVAMPVAVCGATALYVNEMASLVREDRSGNHG